jgi:hypothetical protein
VPPAAFNRGVSWNLADKLIASACCRRFKPKIKPALGENFKHTSWEMDFDIHHHKSMPQGFVVC